MGVAATRLALVLVSVAAGACDCGGLDDMASTDAQVADNGASADAAVADAGAVDGHCVPACEERECGDDDCGGSCGDCTENNVCLNNGTCLCLPQCADKDCGGDGCGGSCGTCIPGWECGESGLCDACAEGYVGYPSCVDDPCLPDPCHGQGTCADGRCTCGGDHHGELCEFSCSDSQQNGAERGLDCGGPCATSCEVTPLNDNDDGTVTDPNTHLIWQKTPNSEGLELCQSMMDYRQCPAEERDAANHCESNADGLPGTGWRLPTISELRSLVLDCDNMYWNPETDTGGACGVTDDCLSYWMCSPACEDCTYRSGPGEEGYYQDPLFANSGHSWFWSSSPSEQYIDRGWSIAFYSGLINNNYIFNDFGVRCVREAP